MNIQPEEALRLSRKLQEEGRSRQEAQEEVARRLVGAMSPEQNERLRQLMGDKDAVERLLASPQARNLMKMFGQNQP